MLPHSKAEKDGPYAPATAFHLIDWRTCAGHGARAPWSGISCPFLSADVRGSCGGDLASLQAIKQSVFEARNLSHDKALAREMELGVPVSMSEDGREGTKAFREKRSPCSRGGEGPF